MKNKKQEYEDIIKRPFRLKPINNIDEYDTLGMLDSLDSILGLL